MSKLIQVFLCWLGWHSHYCIGDRLYCWHCNPHKAKEEKKKARSANAFLKWWRSLGCLPGLACPSCGRGADGGAYRHEFNSKAKLFEVVATRYTCPKSHSWIIPTKEEREIGS